MMMKGCSRTCQVTPAAPGGLLCGRWQTTLCFWWPGLVCRLDQWSQVVHDVVVLVVRSTVTPVAGSLAGLSAVGIEQVLDALARSSFMSQTGFSSVMPHGGAVKLNSEKVGKNSTNIFELSEMCHAQWYYYSGTIPCRIFSSRWESLNSESGLAWILLPPIIKLTTQKSRICAPLHSLIACRISIQAPSNAG
ncbi:hypothetical protein BDR05DRAFT_944823 [Suillus weaverae]|nr:hypothetical protein BDR05DRAFT_944823 [Suillus weaverae]